MKLLLLTIFFLTFSQHTFAYIDPGTGSALLSGLIGLFVSLGIATKTYWYKLKTFITKPNNENNIDIGSVEDQNIQ